MLDYGAFPAAVATVVGCCHINNDRGEIVGFSIEPANPYFGRALIWQGTEPKDLNDFVRDPGPFVQLTALSRSVMPERSFARASSTLENCTPVWQCRTAAQHSMRAFRLPHGNWAAQCLSPKTRASCFGVGWGCLGGKRQTARAQALITASYETRGSAEFWFSNSAACSSGKTKSRRLEKQV